MGILSFSKSQPKVNWIKFKDPSQLDEFKSESHQTPVLIFKHSTRCSISSMAKHRLESNWDLDVDQIIPVYLDLLAYRSISNQIESELGVNHESPQVILLRNGQSIYNASHNSISVDAIKKAL